jgi:hypothetical protein
MALLVLLEALSPVERAVLGRRRQSAGDREAAGPAVARHAAARRPAPPGPGPRRLDPAIRAVVNPGKLGHIGPVSDVARLPPAQNAQFRAPKYGHPSERGSRPERQVGARLSSGPRVVGGLVIAQRTTSPAVCLCSAALGMNVRSCRRPSYRIEHAPGSPGTARRLSRPWGTSLMPSPRPTSLQKVARRLRIARTEPPFAAVRRLARALHSVIQNRVFCVLPRRPGRGDRGGGPTRPARTARRRRSRRRWAR